MVREIALKSNSEQVSINALKLSMVNFDTVLFDATFEEIVLHNDFEFVFINIFMPLMNELGILWQTNAISPSHEHFLIWVDRRLQAVTSWLQFKPATLGRLHQWRPLLQSHGHSAQQGCYGSDLRLYSMSSSSVLPPVGSRRVRTVPNGCHGLRRPRRVGSGGLTEPSACARCESMMHEPLLAASSVPGQLLMAACEQYMHAIRIALQFDACTPASARECVRGQTS